MKYTIKQIKVYSMMFAMLAVAIVSSGIFNQVSAAPKVNFTVSGAIFTTTEAGDVVNGNIYADKNDVYLNGGPRNANGPALTDGIYYFQVTNPSTGTLLSSDAASCRQILVSGGRVMGPFGACTHPSTSNGGVKLMPYDDTTNNGGVYKVALILKEKFQASNGTYIPVTSTTVVGNEVKYDESSAKFDTFRIRKTSECNPETENCGDPDTYDISGVKFYDANNNKQKDNGEPFLAGVNILVNLFQGGNPLDGSSLFTDANGFWERTGIEFARTYTVNEVVPFPGTDATSSYYWRMTLKTPGISGNSYEGDSSSAGAGHDFGNICFRPAANGKTIGFWSNKNGAKEITRMNEATTLQFLRDQLNLQTYDRRGGTIPFNPTTVKDFQTWLLDGNAVNMAYMLSVQMAATELNIRAGYYNSTGGRNTLIDVTDPNDPAETLTVRLGDMLDEANLSLGLNPTTLHGNPVRQDQETYKNLFDDLNNNRNYSLASLTPCAIQYDVTQ